MNRKLNRTPVEYLLPELEPILAETYGLIIYQEQFSQIATAISECSDADADLLRRALVRRKEPELTLERSKFIDGARQNGICLERAWEIFELLKSSNGYTFSKAHSVAYGLITYWTAYLTSHGVQNCFQSP
jgi:DNA polymerase-3 subunit alpha